MQGFMGQIFDLTNFATWKTSNILFLFFLQETVERQGILVILMDALQNLKDKADTYTSGALRGLSYICACGTVVQDPLPDLC